MLEHVAPLGVTSRILEHAVATGRLERLARGVYVAADAVPPDAVGRHLQVALARQLLRPRLIATGATAALAWGLELDDPDGSASGAGMFVQPPGPGARAEQGSGLQVRIREVPRELRTRHPSGLVLTTPARAAVDTVHGLRLPEALITLDSAARMLLLEGVGSARARSHYRDSKALAAALAPLQGAARSASTRLDRGRLGSLVQWADPRRESAAESLSYGHMVLAGLRLPELQVRLTDDQGDMYPDFLWREAMLVGEVDGNIKYETRADLVAERRRQARMEALGFLVVRWEALEIRTRPAAVMRRVGGAIESRTTLGRSA